MHLIKDGERYPTGAEVRMYEDVDFVTAWAWVLRMIRNHWELHVVTDEDSGRWLVRLTRRTGYAVGGIGDSLTEATLVAWSFQKGGWV